MISDTIQPAKGKKCQVCGNERFWRRSPSMLGGPGGRLCGRCHPNPVAQIQATMDDFTNSTAVKGKRYKGTG